MTFTINVTITSPQFDRLEKFMSALSDQIKAASDAADAAIARVSQDVEFLKGQIADLTAKVAEAPTPEDIAALRDLKIKLAAIDPLPDNPPPA